MGQLPSTSPYVTSVGGTSLSLDRGNRIRREAVCNDAPFGVPAAGGGGLSRLVARPAHQRGPRVPGGRRRAVPDVSFYADALPGYTFYWAGNAAQVRAPWFATRGTSISAPLLAGAVAFIGLRARRAGRGRVGLLNRTLYALARPQGGARPVRGLRGQPGRRGEPRGRRRSPAHEVARRLGEPPRGDPVEDAGRLAEPPLALPSGAPSNPPLRAA